MSDNEVLGDSQSSDDELGRVDLPTWKDNNYNNEDLDLSDSDSDSGRETSTDIWDANNIHEDEDKDPTYTVKGNKSVQSAVDQILQRVQRSSSSRSSISRRPAINRNNIRGSSQKNDPGQIEITKSNLGDSFDSKISDKVKQLNRVHEVMESSIHPPSSSNDNKHRSIHDLKKQYIATLEGNQAVLDPTLIDIICRDETGRYRDWFFITKNSKPEIDISTNSSFFYSIGADPIRLQSQFHIQDIHLSELDPYPKIHHPDYILQKYMEVPPDDSSFKWWLYLILDKTIYNSLQCNIIWCNKIMLPRFIEQYGSMETLVELYWQYANLKERKYYLLYRLTRLLPTLKPIFIQNLFDNDPEQVVTEFDKLFDLQNYKDLLYFILFIYGSVVYPIGKDSINPPIYGDDTNENDKEEEEDQIHQRQLQRSMGEYFKDCIIDVSSDGECAREIPITLSILKLFSFQSSV